MIYPLYDVPLRGKKWQRSRDTVKTWKEIEENEKSIVKARKKEKNTDWLWLG